MHDPDTNPLRLSKKLSNFSMMFYRETSQLQTPHPKRPYDVSRGQNRYARLPLRASEPALARGLNFLMFETRGEDQPYNLYGGLPVHACRA